ncbi:MAG: hypothetical protein J5J00_08610 [Deltaproteobacteria bacterium]|nr:hypothetical protein [Deltaproteobacteria bacterium]
MTSGSTPSKDEGRTALLKKAVYAAAALALIIWLYGPFLAAHLRYALDPYSYSDDARHHIAPFLRYFDSALFENDYPTDYYLQALSPILWKGVYFVAAQIMDPITFSKFLPYPLWLLAMAGLAAAAYRIGGRPAAFACLLFAIPAPVFFDRMVGGLSRAFAFPLLAWGLYAVTSGRLKLLALLTVLAAGFYPAPALLLALLLFFAVIAQHLPARFAIPRGQDGVPSLKQSAFLLGGTAVLCVLMVAPVLVSTQPYGKRLTESDSSSYPEVGAGGRYGNSEHGPHMSYISGFQRYIKSSFLPRREPYLESLIKKAGLVETKRRSFLFHKKAAFMNGYFIAACAFLLYAAFSRRFSQASALRGLILFALSSIAAHAASIAFYPHLFFPQRYLVYTVPLIALTAFACSLVLAVRLLVRRERLQGPICATVALLALLCLGGPSKENEGYITAEPGLVPLYQFISHLPADSVVAGWPKGVINNVAYLSRRKVFLTSEINQAFHQEYLNRMRERMEVLMRAYFSRVDLSPLRELRDHYGVTHLIVDLSHFSKGSPPQYFLPYGERIPEFLSDPGPQDFLVTQLAEKAAIYRNGRVAILELEGM